MRTWARCAAAVLLAVLLAASSYVVYRFPTHNWDMIAYIGTAFSYSTNDIRRVHEFTYDAVRFGVDNKSYEELTFSNPYRQGMARSSEAFWQQLPFYRVKPAYPALMAILINFGVPPVTASTVIPLAAYVVSCILIALWVTRYWPGALGLVLSSALLFEPHLLKIARLSTPDMLSALALLSAGYLLIHKRKVTAALAILFIAILVRPDNLLFGASLTLAMIACRVLDVRAGLGFVACSAVLYLVIAEISGNYGWPTHFYHSNVEFLHNPSGFVSPLDLGDYIEIYKRGAISVALNEDVALFAFLSMLAGFLYLRVEGYRSHGFCLCAATLLFMGLTFLAFPRESDRILAGDYLVVLLLMVRAGQLAIDAGGHRTIAKPAAPLMNGDGARWI